MQVILSLLFHDLMTFMKYNNQELHGSSELKYKEIVIGLKSAIIQLDLQKVHFLFLVQ